MSGANGNGHRWSKFWWQDHQREMGLRMCSMAARGLWLEMLCLMHEADGYLLLGGKALDAKQLAFLVGGCSAREVTKYLTELERNRVFSRTEDGIIYCRRMVRDIANEAGWREVGRMGGSPTVKRGTVPKDQRVRPFKRSDAPQKTARILAKTGGRCFWCEAPLQSSVAGPDFYQVDHVVAVRDGGTNDEDNLVPACTVCNLKRSKSDCNPPVGVGCNSDHNPPEIPTPTIPQFRPQPTKKLEADSDLSEREESSKISNPTSYLTGSSRAREEKRPGNGLDDTLRDAGINQPKSGSAYIDPNAPKDCDGEVLPDDAVGQGAVMAQVRRIAKAHRNLAIPQQVKRSPTIQADAITAHPEVVDCSGYRWAPVDPIRTPEEMMAELLGISIEEARLRFPSEART